MYGQRCEAQRERQRSYSRGYRQLDCEFRLARGNISPGHGLLLESTTIVSICSSIAMTRLFACRQEGVAGGAVIARIGDARLPREIGHCVDFVPDRWTTAGSTAAIAFRSESSPDLASVRPPSENAASCVTAESIAQYFKSPKCLLAELASRTAETSLASSVEASRVANQLSDQKRGGAGEDRQ